MKIKSLILKTIVLGVWVSAGYASSVPAACKQAEELQKQMSNLLYSQIALCCATSKGDLSEDNQCEFNDSASRVAFYACLEKNIHSPNSLYQFLGQLLQKAQAECRNAQPAW